MIAAVRLMLSAVNGIEQALPSARRNKEFFQRSALLNWPHGPVVFRWLVDGLPAPYRSGCLKARRPQSSKPAGLLFHKILKWCLHALDSLSVHVKKCDTTSAAPEGPPQDARGPLQSSNHRGLYSRASTQGKARFRSTTSRLHFFTPSGNFLNDVDPLETLTYLEARVDTLTRVKHVEQKF